MQLMRHPSASYWNGCLGKEEKRGEGVRLLVKDDADVHNMVMLQFNRGRFYSTIPDYYSAVFNKHMYLAFILLYGGGA